MSVYAKGGTVFLLLWAALAALSRLAWWLLTLVAGQFSWELVLSIIAGLSLSVLLIRWMPDPSPQPNVKIISEDVVLPPEPVPPRAVRSARTPRDVN